MNIDNWNEDDKLYKMRPMPVAVATNHPSQLNTVFVQFILDKFKHSLAEILLAISKEDCGDDYMKRIMLQAYEFVGVDFDEDSCCYFGVRKFHSDYFPLIVIDCPRTVYWDDITIIGFVFYNGYDDYELFLGEEVVYATFIMRPGEMRSTITEYYNNQEKEFNITPKAMVEEFLFHVEKIVDDNDV